MFFERRWFSTFNACELLKFGAELPDIVKQFTSNDFANNKVSRDVPGMVGDMNRSGKYGFVGLSKDSARPGRLHVNSRSDAT